MKRAKKRDHLIDVATDLFNRHGYHASGVDQIIAEAGIAKTTLYRHFGSKDELIVAVLQRIDERFRTDMRDATDRLAENPKDKLLATFDFLHQWYQRSEFCGCPFMSAAGEFGDRGSPVFQQTVLHKRLMIAYFAELARAAELDQPEWVAEQINLLHEGATAVAQVNGDPNTALKAKAVASKLIN